MQLGKLLDVIDFNLSEVNITKGNNCFTILNGKYVNHETIKKLLNDDVENIVALNNTIEIKLYNMSRNRRRYYTLKENHQCAKCGKPNTFETYCEECKIQKEEDKKIIREMRLLQDKCPYCGKPFDNKLDLRYDGKRYNSCYRCRQKRNEYQAIRRVKNNER